MERQPESEVEAIYRDSLAAAIHEGLADLASLGAIPESEARKFGAVALKPNRRFSAEDVRTLRHREGATQAVFSFHLGVSVNTLSQWERGERAVTGAAAKLLTLVEERGLRYIA